MRHNTVMRFRIGALLGWGVVIYAVMFLLWSAFVTYGFVEGMAPRILGLVILVALAITAGRSLKANSWHDIIPYSICWGLIRSEIRIGGGDGAAHTRSRHSRGARHNRRSFAEGQFLARYYSILDMLGPHQIGNTDWWRGWRRAYSVSSFSWRSP